jgi:hypothetical protein
LIRCLNFWVSISWWWNLLGKLANKVA